MLPNDMPTNDLFSDTTVTPSDDAAGNGAAVDGIRVGIGG